MTAQHEHLPALLLSAADCLLLCSCCP